MLASLLQRHIQAPLQGPILRLILRPKKTTVQRIGLVAALCIQTLCTQALCSPNFAHAEPEQAQTTAKIPRQQAKQTKGANVVTQAQQRLKLKVSEGKLINLPRNAKAVLIADPEIANFQLPAPDKLYVFGKQAGNTSVLVLDAARNVSYQAHIAVSHDAAELQALVKQAKPELQDIAITSSPKQIVVSGSVRTPREADQLMALVEGYVDLAEKAPQQVVNQLSITQSNQVHVRLRIAEMSRETSQRLGIRWGSMNLGGLVTDRYSVVRDFNFATGGLGASTKLAGVLEALEGQGLAKLLAEPSLTATSGESASFLAGGEYPLPVYDGNDRITINYKQFGVLLGIAPTILDNGRISLKVTPEVSSLDFDTPYEAFGLSIPTLKTRRAETTVELASGQSFVLAGLLSSNDINNASGVPFLSQLPVIGSLFRSTNFKRDETELVLIATAYLAEPSNPQDLRLPTDSYRPASTFERLLFGRLEGDPRPWQQGPTGTNSKATTSTTNGRLIGDNGFYY